MVVDSSGASRTFPCWGLPGSVSYDTREPHPENCSRAKPYKGRFGAFWVRSLDMAWAKPGSGILPQVGVFVVVVVFFWVGDLQCLVLPDLMSCGFRIWRQFL